jgi:RHS repeat-associated protein
MSLPRPLLFVCSLLSLALIAPASRAQIPNAGDTTSTPAPGMHDYLGSPAETVNPANGSVSIRIPVPIPPGRGLTLPFSFAYDSNGAFFVAAGPTGGAPKYLTTTTSGPIVGSLGGWSYSYPLMSFSGGTFTIPGSLDHLITCHGSTNYVFQDPNGNRHNLGLSVSANVASPDGSDNCNQGLQGDGEFTSGTEGPILATTSIPTINNGTFPSVGVIDGDGTGYSLPGGNPSTNGITTLATSVSDRNGNTVTITNASSAVTYTDTLDRTALHTSGMGGNPDTITVSGLGAPYQVHWTTASAHFTESMLNLCTGAGCQACPTTLADTSTVASSIALPNGTQFTFTYDTTYGMLTKMVYPSGGYVRYVWVLNSKAEAIATFGSGDTWDCRYDFPAISDRYVSFDGSAEVLHQHFAYTTTWPNNTSLAWTTKTTTVTTTDLVRNTSFTTAYTYTPLGSAYVPNCGACILTQQIPAEQTIQYNDIGGNQLKTVNKIWQNIRILKSQQTSLPLPPLNSPTNFQVSKTSYGYDANEMLTEQDDYDFGLNAPGPIMRVTATTYSPDTAMAASHVIDRPSSVIVYSDLAKTNRVAETDYTYDTPIGTTTSGIVQHPFTCNCGNLTKESRWINSSGSTLATNFTNDDTGQLLSMTDSRSNQTTYSYTDSYSSGTPPGPTNAYLTQIILPNTGVAHIEKFAYAYASGELTSSTDQNNLVTTYKYVDNLARLTETDYPTPDGGVTTSTYVDTPNAVSVETKHKMDASRWTDSFTLYDGLMHPIVRSTANGETTPWDRTDICYDGNALPRFSSYPYQVASATNARNCTTGVGDTSTYDALGRATQVAHSDGSTILINYTARATQVQDEGNGTHRVQRTSQIDGLGQLASICEVTSSPQLGNGGTPGGCPQDIAATGFLTTYSFTTLGDLLSVTQGTLTSRNFSYDFLSRLTTATNPESGTISYVYDTDPAGACPAPYSFAGLLVKKVDARGVRTCYQYVDALNRMTQKNYSDGTPTVSFNYDQASAYGVSLLNTTGRLASRSTSAPNPTGEVFSYDQLGRVKNNSQCTPQNCSTPAVFPVTYTYDLLGDMITSTNGAGITLTYAVNTAARLTSLTSSLSDSNHPGTLFSSPHYNAAGALLSATLGGSISETRIYDVRLRLASIADGSNYSLTIPPSGGYAPNSDILAANDSANLNWVYSYDDFNRLICSNLATNGTCASPTNGLATYTYDYDRYGNRWHQNGSLSMQLSFSGNNNRMDSHSYDAAGNLSNDVSHTYFYDAENRIIQVDGTLGACSSATACYVYNTSGHRVRKTTGGTSIDYLYDLRGREITELSSAGAWNRGEVYVGGRHLATYYNGTTNLIHADWLGTERVRTTAAGASCETIGSLPFGDGQTTSGSCGDPSPLHFTGKERDLETGLDNFGARYNSSNFGRFMSPDLGPFDLANPQSLNRYVLELNNPLRYVDLYGNEVIDIGSYVLTTYTQLSQEIGVFDWALALGATARAGSGYEYADSWNKSVGIGQDPVQLVTDTHPAELPSASGAYFRDYSTSWSINVDFREDPGAGTTASISFTKNGNGVMPSSTGFDAFRTEDMPRAEASLFNFFNLQGLSSERLSALSAEATRQWKATGDPRYFEILLAAEHERERREEEERKKKEKERENKCKGTGEGESATCPVT